MATRRSAPRPIGAKLGVSEGGELAGSVSGGCVENEVYGLAQEALAGGPPIVARYRISDEFGLSVGLHCGGELVQEDGRTVFCHVFARRRRVVFGAVDAAEHLCRFAAALGWRTTVVDARGKLATPDRRIPSADELVVGWPEEALAKIQPDDATAIVVLTHEDRFDIPGLGSALASEAYYIGADRLTKEPGAPQRTAAGRRRR